MYCALFKLKVANIELFGVVGEWQGDALGNLSTPYSVCRLRIVFPSITDVILS